MLRQGLRKRLLTTDKYSHSEKEDDAKALPVIVSGVGSVEDMAATWPGVSDRPGSDSDLRRTFLSS